MIVLGIDGSLTCTGLAVVETDGVPGRERIIATARKRSEPEDGDDGARCRMMVEAAMYLVQRYRPNLVGIEMPYVPRTESLQGSLRLAGLKGAFESALSGAGCEVVPVVTTSASKALGIKHGCGRAEKKRQAVANVLSRYGVLVSHDAADAIGVALAAVVKRRKQESAGAQLGLPGVKAGRKSKRGR